MNPKSIIPIALALLALASPAWAQDKEPTAAEKAAKAQAAAYVAAFNKGEAKALAALYAEDVQYTNEDGATVIGRAAVQEGLAKFFAKNKGAKLSVEMESARFLTPEVLVEKGLTTIGDETTRYVCSYVKKDGAWLISELNETTLPPANAAEVALADLSWLVGSWKDNSPGVTVATNVAWTKNKHFLRRSITVTREGEDTIEATEVIGYDPVAGGLRSWVFDSEGGFGEGTWKRDDNKWMVSFKGTGPDGALSSAQHILTYLDEKKYTWESISRERNGEALPNLDKIEVVREAGK
jgi:uncharacterized protein (TIGR02246 family)